MRDFKQLVVWQRSHLLTLSIYESTMAFPSDERFGLTSQMRRAASSVPANLAEGCGRDGDAELARFTQIAMGSATELEYHLLLAHDLGYMNVETYQKLSTETIEIKRMLSGFLQRLRSD